jgi:preprotein translocase subunit SecA
VIPGLAQAMLSLEDELIRVYLGAGLSSQPVQRFLQWLSHKEDRREGNGEPITHSCTRVLFRLAQVRAEHAHAATRRQLLGFDEQLGDL